MIRGIWPVTADDASLPSFPVASESHFFLKCCDRHNRYDLRDTVDRHCLPTPFYCFFGGVLPCGWNRLHVYSLPWLFLAKPRRPLRRPRRNALPRGNPCLPFPFVSNRTRTRRISRSNCNCSSRPIVGRTGNSTGKAQPAQHQFLFHAGSDTEYWFAIRTIDRSGQLRPESIPGPGLCVLVDTKPPVLRITAQRSPTGQVSVRWEIDERNVKPNGLNLQYRTARDEPWQSVAIDRQRHDGAETPRSGETTFWPKPGSNEIEIQAQIADAAGNQTIEHAQVVLAPKSTPAPTMKSNGSVAIAISPAIGGNRGVEDEGRGTGDEILGLPPGERPADGQLAAVSIGIRRRLGWPLGHWPGRVVGHPRRRQDLAELRRRQRQPQPAAGQRRRRKAFMVSAWS